MDKAKILRLCDEIEDNAKEIRERTVKNSYFMAQTIINRVLVIYSEITAPPKSNADRIRQMTDEELADWLNGICNRCISESGCTGCPIYDGCASDAEWQEKWLKQEVSEDAEA